MITDAQLRLSQAQSLIGAAATTVSTNTIDLLSANTNLGRGRPRKIFAEITTALAGGTSVRAEFIQSANSDLSSPDVLVVGPTFADAAALAGVKLLDVTIPDNTKRYVGVQYVTIGTHSAGQVWAGVVADTDRQPYLPANTGL
jgi:hypothetical protein